jgi:hypothetical protein
MQIDKTRFKPFMKIKKQHQPTNNLYLYREELGHVVHECPKKHGPYAARAISVTNPQLEE